MVGHVGLIPTRISALGLEFDVPAQNAFLVVMVLVVTYMASAFSIYATADFFIWRKRYYDYKIAAAQKFYCWTQEDQEEYDEIHQLVPPIHWYWQKAPLVAWLRIVFEFILPLIIGIYTAVLLGLRAWHP